MKMVTVRIQGKSKPKGKHVKAVHVRRAGGGFVSETHFEGKEPGEYVQSEENVHKSAEAAAKHMKSMFGEGPGADGTAKHENAESAAMEKAEEDAGDQD